MQGNKFFSHKVHVLLYTSAQVNIDFFVLKLNRNNISQVKVLKVCAGLNWNEQDLPSLMPH